MSEYIRLQANGADAYPDASTENTYRPNGTSVESALVNLESNVTTLGGVAGEAKTLAEQNSVKIATAEQEISDINSSLSHYNEETDSLDIYYNGEIIGSLYCGFQALEALIPTMTSNTSPSGVAGASYEYTGNDAYQAFDNDSSTKWVGGSDAQSAGETNSASIQYQFPNNVNVKEVGITCANYTEMVSCVIETSTDGVSWNTAITKTSDFESAGLETRISITPTTLKYIKLTINQKTLNTGRVPQILQIQAYGHK